MVLRDKLSNKNVYFILGYPRPLFIIQGTFKIVIPFLIFWIPLWYVPHHDFKWLSCIMKCQFLNLNFKCTISSKSTFKMMTSFDFTSRVWNKSWCIHVLCWVKLFVILVFIRMHFISVIWENSFEFHPRF